MEDKTVDWYHEIVSLDSNLDPKHPGSFVKKCDSETKDRHILQFL